MADKIKAIKIKQKNGTYSEEVPISVNVQNVQWDENNHTLLDALGSVDISSSGKGNLQHQIDELDGDKISTNEFNSRLNNFLKDQISADTTDWLDDNVNPVGSAVIVDKTLTIEGAAADALAVKTELNKKANASNTYTKAEVNAAIDAKKIEVDDTLSITGTAADAKAVGDELTAVKADLGAQTGVISLIKDYYIKTSDTPISLTPIASTVGRMYAVVNCTAGDKFVINAYSNSAQARAWCFIDSTNTALSMADELVTITDTEITAPANASKLIINDMNSGMSYKVGNNLASKIADSAQGKVDIQQSPNDFGKALIINRDGKVRPGVISGGGGLTDSVKIALLTCFRHVYWDDEHSKDYYDALYAALYAAESRLTAILDYGNTTIFADDPLGKVKRMMKVYYDGEEVNIGDCTITGDMIAGQNVLTVTYNDESTSIMVEAEEKPASRLVLTAGDLLKFNGWGMSSGGQGHKPPYLVSAATARVYYSAKGHLPYVDENNTPVTGVYPIPIPMDATHVRVSVTPNNYKIAVNCWKYISSTRTYSFISGTDTGFKVGYLDLDIPQYSENARALNMFIAKQDASAIGSSEEPTQVVVQFT